MAGRVHVGLRLLALAQDELRVPVEHLAGLGRRHAALRPQQQLLANLALQRRELLAQRRLGDVQDVGGLGQAADVDDLHEVLQAPEVHRSAPAGARRATWPAGRSISDRYRGRANSSWPPVGAAGIASAPLSTDSDGYVVDSHPGRRARQAHQAIAQHIRGRPRQRAAPRGPLDRQSRGRRAGLRHARATSAQAAAPGDGRGRHALHRAGRHARAAPGDRRQARARERPQLRTRRDHRRRTAPRARSTAPSRPRWSPATRSIDPGAVLGVVSRHGARLRRRAGRRRLPRGAGLQAHAGRSSRPRSRRGRAG